MNAALPIQATTAMHTQAPSATLKQLFRDTMAKLPAAVHIITTDGPSGKAGITASAVCSLTDAPPTLIVCLNREARANHIAQANGYLAVNVLGEHGIELSSIFAGQRGLEMEDRFGTGAAWTALSTPAPALQDAVCTFDCVIDQVSDVGTHSVLFCRVLAIGDIKPTRNLLYHERQYKVCPAAQQSATP